MWASHAHAPDGEGPKRRRGRQPRPCTLSPAVRAAASQFAASVGAPRVVEPAGFRDFVGWLQRLQGAGAADAWSRLLSSLLAEAAGDNAAVQRMQPDVVREIIANVVTIRAGESSKLISTNARRQSARPEHGVTLMKIFDRALARASRSGGPASAGRAHPVAHAHHATPHYAPHAAHGSHAAHAAHPSAGGGQRTHRSRAVAVPRPAAPPRAVAAPRPPMAAPSRRSGPHTMRLPSMQELEESLRRR